MILVGVPSLLIGFIIFGICSIPEGEYEEYSESGSENGDISSNEEVTDPAIRRRRPHSEPITAETSKTK